MKRDRTKHKEVITIVEEVPKRRKIRLVRVIFKEFDSTRFIFRRFKTLTALNILLIKLFTVPIAYNGPYKYDHVELMTPNRSRFSIRKEPKQDKFGLNPKPMGVYLISKDGLGPNSPKLQEMTNQRYKLVFVFQITEKQERELYRFIDSTKGEQYSLRNANFNVICRKIFKTKGEKLMFDSWKGGGGGRGGGGHSKKGKLRVWDCVTLIMRGLVEIGVVPEFGPDGKKTPLLGLSAHDMAMLLLKMYVDDQIPSCRYVASREVQEESEYMKTLSTFYSLGSRIIRARE
jgi:hypothetical protein